LFGKRSPAAWKDRSFAWLPDLLAGTIVRKPSPAAPGVPAAHEQLFGQVPWRLRKKKEQENQNLLFLLLQLNKGYLNA